ncbi:hypothetical protein A3A21_01510 [Candidatus Jorgensenbacteria bacterium RIFCSPLOWO2_01_FULL_45_25b]|uniref:DUF4129 domain-containing protein n=1 Tax=Candidatus Jorgensenbacteria bacterium RIFCSPLOWO2_01_FULL_45_25b TaxID=1798471 RepID=A0A1F6BT11_9BACT|nr:MAG: hypothetical protein A3A21_01510 [Candidatus Jorgensenbacteria bacterium RIFCSPLOWO2_01_FULL_45_25b]
MSYISFFIQTFKEAFFGIPWWSVYNGIKYLFLSITFFLVAGFVFVLPKAWKYKSQFTYDYKPGKKTITEGENNKALKHRWETLMKKSESSPPDSLLQAIIQADEFTDEILQLLELKGEHMADRIEQIDKENVRTLERLWRAHRTKNDIVNTSGFEISDEDAKETLKDYQAFLEEIGIV